MLAGSRNGCGGGGPSNIAGRNKAWTTSIEFGSQAGSTVRRMSTAASILIGSLVARIADSSSVCSGAVAGVQNCRASTMVLSFQYFYRLKNASLCSSEVTRLTVQHYL